MRTPRAINQRLVVLARRGIINSILRKTENGLNLHTLHIISGEWLSTNLPAELVAYREMAFAMLAKERTRLRFRSWRLFLAAVAGRGVKKFDGLLFFIEKTMKKNSTSAHLRAKSKAMPRLVPGEIARKQQQRSKTTPMYTYRTKTSERLSAVGITTGMIDFLRTRRDDATANDALDYAAKATQKVDNPAGYVIAAALHQWARWKRESALGDFYESKKCFIEGANRDNPAGRCRVAAGVSCVKEYCRGCLHESDIRPQVKIYRKNTISKMQIFPSRAEPGKLSHEEMDALAKFRSTRPPSSLN